jgi:nitronate monooxygenase
MTTVNVNRGLLDHAAIEVPLICGAMYPCSNPELVAAVSEAGGLGIVQPISLTYVHGYDFRQGLRLIRSLTAKPVGMNALIEQSSRRYHERMRQWIDIALEEGLRFFVTSLGKPDWVVERVHAAGGVVYHDVTHRHWAEKGIEAGVDGLIAVNNRAGGHAGEQDAQRLYASLHDLGVPLVCAGGIGHEQDFVTAMQMGYAGVQMGTRFIATPECRASEAYKRAIMVAGADDIVLSERITGVPVALIRTPYVERIGLKAGPLARWLLRGSKTKHWMRMFYTLKSFWRLKQTLLKEGQNDELWQAGKSVAGIRAIEPAAVIVQHFAQALESDRSGK